MGTRKGVRSSEGDVRQWVWFVSMPVLQDERQDGRTQRWVVTELLQVAAVFPFSPHGHLDEAHQCEEGHRQTLSHQGEAQPRPQLRAHTHVRMVISLKIYIIKLNAFYLTGALQSRNVSIKQVFTVCV